MSSPKQLSMFPETICKGLEYCDSLKRIAESAGESVREVFPQGDYAILLATEGSKELLYAGGSFEFPQGSALEVAPQELLETAQSSITHRVDALVQRGLVFLKELSDGCTVLTVPLRDSDTDTGLLLVVPDGDGLNQPPTPDTREFLANLASQLSMAVSAYQVLASHRTRIDLLTMVNRISSVMTSILDIDELLATVIGSLTETFDFEYAGIYLLKGDTNTLLLESQGGELATLIPPHIQVRLGSGLIGTSGQQGITIVANDVSKDPRYRDTLPIKSEMCACLKYRGEILGVLDVQSAKLNSFTEDNQMTIKTLAHQLSVTIHNARLFKRINSLHISTIETLSAAIDARDRYSRGHSKRVAEYAVLLGRQMGFERDELTSLRYSGILHDIGKIGIDDSILHKRGPLTAMERAVIMSHPSRGAAILNASDMLSHIVPAVLHHHEWYGGGGYPDGQIGDEIPLYSRIIAIADAFEAMTSSRVYRPAMVLENALSELVQGSGTQFDPDLVDTFVERIRREKSRGTSFYKGLIAHIDEQRRNGIFTSNPTCEEDTSQFQEGAEQQLPGGGILPVHGRELRILYEISLETRSILNLDQLLDRILSILSETIGSHRFYILLLDENTDELVVRAAKAPAEDDKTLDFRIKLGSGLTGWVAQEGKAQVVNDTAKEPRFIPGPIKKTKSELVIPLVAEGNIIGVLDIQSDFSNAFTREDLYILTTIAGQIASAIDISQYHKKVAWAAVTDGATGAFNHSYFYQRLEEELLRAKRYGHPVSLVIFDVNNLKDINDTYGHLAGDKALKQFASFLKENVRACDVVARYGGDEFAMIVPETPKPQALKALRRLMKRVEGTVITMDDCEFPIPSISYGIAAFPDDADKPSDLVRIADKIMYSSKRRAAQGS